MKRALAAFALAVAFGAGRAHAQAHHHAAPPDTTSHAAGHAKAAGDMAGMDMSHMDTSSMHAHMNGMYGPYALSREASGTAWQPEAAGHGGVHVMRGAWTIMLHGMADVAFDRQGGPRGERKLYGDNMAMVVARRPFAAATLGFRAMLSAEPATIGRTGYPLLLQTGESADGRTPLIDRQHPHDLFMELATSLSVARGDRSLFLYAGLPGEPALGPPAFMHRFSSMNLPQAPITHHWLDSTHISFGVLTGGVVARRVKLEASSFRGREPDENRWNLESPRLDSHSFRLSVNPTDEWAIQVSHGRIHSPEALEPGVDQDRTTASALREGTWNGGRWEGMLAWGRDANRPGHTLDAFTAEATVELHETHLLLARVERVRKDELFTPPDPRAGRSFSVGELSAGYRYDFRSGEHAVVGLGVLATAAFVPHDLAGSYGSEPVSVSVFLHLGLP